VTPQDIVSWLQAKGYKGKLDEGVGRSSIESADSGVPFHIFFGRYEIESDDLDAFDDLTFLAGGEIEGNPNLAALNQRNATDKYIRTYFEDDTIWFEMDVPFNSSELTPSMFERLFDTWIDWFPDAIKNSAE